jgi:hypothetical protein
MGFVAGHVWTAGLMNCIPSSAPKRMRVATRKRPEKKCDISASCLQRKGKEHVPFQRGPTEFR